MACNRLLLTAKASNWSLLSCEGTLLVSNELTFSFKFVKPVPSQEARLWVGFEPFSFCWVIIPWTWCELLAGAEPISSNTKKRHAAVCDQGLDQSQVMTCSGSHHAAASGWYSETAVLCIIADQAPTAYDSALFVADHQSFVLPEH